MTDPDLATAIKAAVARQGKQANIATQLRWTESKVSEVQAPLLKPDMEIYLKTIQMKVVPEDMVCVDKKTLEAVIAFLHIAVPGLTLNQLLGK